MGRLASVEPQAKRPARVPAELQRKPIRAVKIKAENIRLEDPTLSATIAAAVTAPHRE
jgi:hypothetical protein